MQYGAISLIIWLILLYQLFYGPSIDEWQHEQTKVKFVYGFIITPIVSFLFLIIFTNFILAPKEIVLDFDNLELIQGNKTINLNNCTKVIYTFYPLLGSASITFENNYRITKIAPYYKFENSVNGIKFMKISCRFKNIKFCINKPNTLINF